MSENPQASTFARQNWETWRQAMRMAKNLLTEQQPVAFHEREQSEHYFSYVPMIAAQIVREIGGDAGFMDQAPESVRESRINTMNTMLREVTKLNEEIEKGFKK